MYRGTKGRALRYALRTAAWSLLAAALAMPKLRPRADVPRPLALSLLACGPPAAAVGLPRGRVRAYAVFLAQMWAYLRAFELTYARPERLRGRLRVDYPIALDRRLGGGTPPGVRLQGWRRRSSMSGAADLLLGSAYLAWAAERHAALLWLLLRRRQDFARAAALVGTSFDVGWLLYSAFPTAPPWWAAKHGRLPGLRRVLVDVSERLPLVPHQTERDEDQGNPFASMPSTHTASAAAVALALADVDQRAAAPALAYSLALAFALVYLGEHYVVDVLGGAALAIAVRAAEPAAAPLARRTAGAVEVLASAAWPRRRRMPSLMRSLPPWLRGAPLARR